MTNQCWKQALVTSSLRLIAELPYHKQHTALIRRESPFAHDSAVFDRVQVRETQPGFVGPSLPDRARPTGLRKDYCTSTRGCL
jgi:hypothetical protein